MKLFLKGGSVTSSVKSIITGLGLVRTKYGLCHCPCVGNGSLRHTLEVAAAWQTKRLTLGVCDQSPTKRAPTPLCRGNQQLMWTTTCRRERGAAWQGPRPPWPTRPAFLATRAQKHFLHPLTFDIRMLLCGWAGYSLDGQTDIYLSVCCDTDIRCAGASEDDLCLTTTPKPALWSACSGGRVFPVGLPLGTPPSETSFHKRTTNPLPPKNPLYLCFVCGFVSAPALPSSLGIAIDFTFVTSFWREGVVIYFSTEWKLLSLTFA